MHIGIHEPLWDLCREMLALAADPRIDLYIGQRKYKYELRFAEGRFQIS